MKKKLRKSILFSLLLMLCLLGTTACGRSDMTTNPDETTSNMMNDQGTTTTSESILDETEDMIEDATTK